MNSALWEWNRLEKAYTEGEISLEEKDKLQADLWHDHNNGLFEALLDSI